MCSCYSNSFWISTLECFRNYLFTWHSHFWLLVAYALPHSAVRRSLYFSIVSSLIRLCRSVSVTFFLLYEGLWNKQVLANNVTSQQPDVTLRDRKGTCFPIDVSVSSDNIVTEITEERSWSKYWKQSDWSTTQVECESEDDDTFRGA
jgi:hypothetical protein